MPEYLRCERCGQTFQKFKSDHQIWCFACINRWLNSPAGKAAVQEHLAKKRELKNETKN